MPGGVPQQQAWWTAGAPTRQRQSPGLSHAGSPLDLRLSHSGSPWDLRASQWAQSQSYFHNHGHPMLIDGVASPA
eukprot:14835209-Heterocapsa_arctica.AAC.1